MDEVEGTLKIDVDNGIPLSFAHAHHETVFGDTCIVDEHIDRAEIILNIVDYSFGLCEIISIVSVAFSLYTESFKLLFGCFHIFVTIELGECNVGSFRSEFQGDSLADTA